MPNLTISLDEQLLSVSREYAQSHNTSLNSLIRKLLKQSVEKTNKHWLDECIRLMDETEGDSRGEKWQREDLYDV